MKTLLDGLRNEWKINYPTAFNVPTTGSSRCQELIAGPAVSPLVPKLVRRRGTTRR
jgi:hypothetical protein